MLLFSMLGELQEGGSAHLAEGSDCIHPNRILHAFVPVQYGRHSKCDLVVSLIFGAVHGCYNTATQHGEFNIVRVDKDLG